MLISSSIASHDKDVRVRREPDFAHWTCAYMREGEIYLRTSQQGLRIAAPAFFNIPPGLPYDFTVTVPDEHVWCIYSSIPRAASVLDAGASAVQVFKLRLHIETDAAVVAAIEETVSWWQATPRRDALAENALERALLLSAELQRVDKPEYDPRIAKALSYIATHWKRGVSIPDLAAHCCLSASRFSALFRQETGTTPARYIESRRLEAASDRLLSSSMNIAEIADFVGYRNAFHFSTRFRAIYGQSPSDFRRGPLGHRYEIEPQFPEGSVSV